MSDRTPADALARARWDRELDPDHPWHVAWDDVSPRLRQEQVELAEADIELLDAAGFRVVPIPDDNTRALAARLRNQLLKYDTLAGGPPRKGFIVLDDVRAAADLLDGQPQDRPDRCPTCGSDDPRWPGRHSGHLTRPCPDPWHTDGSGDTR